MVKNGVARNDLLRYVAKVSYPHIYKTYKLNFTKVDCQCNTITFNVLMRAAYSDIGDAFVKEEPRTFFMKSKNG